MCVHSECDGDSKRSDEYAYTKPKRIYLNAINYFSFSLHDDYNTLLCHIISIIQWQNGRQRTSGSGKNAFLIYETCDK